MIFKNFSESESSYKTECNFIISFYKAKSYNFETENLIY